MFDDASMSAVSIPLTRTEVLGHIGFRIDQLPGDYQISPDLIDGHLNGILRTTFLNALGDIPMHVNVEMAHPSLRENWGVVLFSGMGIAEEPFTSPAELFDATSAMWNPLRAALIPICGTQCTLSLQVNFWPNVLLPAYYWAIMTDTDGSYDTMPPAPRV